MQAWINLGFYQFKTGLMTWHLAVAIPILFTLVRLGSIFLMPESPRWLVRQGRHLEAKNTTATLKGAADDATEVPAKAELVAVERALESISMQKTSLPSLLSMGEDRLLYRFGLCTLLQFYQQMSGGNLISVYSTVIFEQGLDSRAMCLCETYGSKAPGWVVINTHCQCSPITYASTKMV